jgi:TPR repeat protein
MVVWLGCCFRDGEGCEKDLDKAKEKFFLASELGHVLAMDCLGNLFENSDPERWRWWGRAAALGDSWIFCLILRNKSNCVIWALEVLLSCLQSDKLCKVM